MRAEASRLREEAAHGAGPRADPDPREVGAHPFLDLVVVGSPTHAWSMPRPGTRESAGAKSDTPLVSQGIGVREWLESASLDPGLRTVAYDTRSSHPKVVVAMDHASKSIEKGLAKLGGRRLVPAERFLVAGLKGPLEPGEPERAPG